MPKFEPSSQVLSGDTADVYFPRTVDILKKENILNVLQTSIRVYEAKAKDKDIQLRLKCEEEVRAHINPPLLELAVGNILDNGIKYSDAGKSIEIEAIAEDEQVRIKIQDHGIGIPEEAMSHLFERFYRVDSAASSGTVGTGIGLALASHIVQSHGGRIEVESIPGQGSTFSIFLKLESEL